MGSSTSTNVHKITVYPHADITSNENVSSTIGNTLKPSVNGTEEDNDINNTEDDIHVNPPGAREPDTYSGSGISLNSNASEDYESFTQTVYTHLREQADRTDLDKCLDNDEDYVDVVFEVMEAFEKFYENDHTDNYGLLCSYRNKIGKIILETNLYQLCSNITTSFLQRVCEEGEKRLDKDEVGLYDMSMIVLGNYSDDSDDIAIAIGGDEALIKQLKGSLSVALEESSKHHDPETAISSLFKDDEMLHSSLILFHNASKRESNIQNLRKLQLNDILQKYLAWSGRQDVKMLALSTLAAIVNEDECSIIASNKNSIVIFLDVLRNSLKSQERRSEDWSWSCRELVLTVRQLARNDANKKLLAELGALELLVLTGKTGDETEQFECVRALWALCFDPSNKKKICNDADLGVIDLLVDLKSSTHHGIAKACNGALWTLADALEDSPVTRYQQLDAIQLACGKSMVLTDELALTRQIHFQVDTLRQLFENISDFSKGERCLKFKESNAKSTDSKARVRRRFEAAMEKIKLNTSQGSGKGHIMLSYQWANQKTMKSIRNSIRMKKYRVWMDIDYMAGSTIQAMAEAVENSEIVLMCMSQKYKDSENCRAEAEYAFKMKKCVIPLKMERNYVPDGWLGFICGTKLFYEFTDKYPFERKLLELLKEIDGKMRPDGLPEHVKDIVPVAVQHQKAANFDNVDSAAPQPPNKSLVPNTSIAHYTSVVEIVRKWTRDDISKWWNEQNLKGCLPASVTAGEIAMLLSMRQESPDFLYRCLYDMFKIRNPLSMSKVVWALRDLLQLKPDV